MKQELVPENYYVLARAVAAGYPRRNNVNFAESMYGRDGRCPHCGYLGPAVGTLILGASDTPKAPFWRSMDYLPFEMASSELAAKIRDKFPEVQLRITEKKSPKAPDSFVLIPDVLPTKIWDRSKLPDEAARRLGFPLLHCEVCGNDRHGSPSDFEYPPATHWPSTPQGPLVCTMEQFGAKGAIHAIRQKLYRGDLAQFVTDAGRRKLEWKLIANPSELPTAEM